MLLKLKWFWSDDRKLKSNFIYDEISLEALSLKNQDKLQMLQKNHHFISHLFFSGNLELLNSELLVAIVGSRKPNPYARSMTAMIASELAKYKACIISGGALGIDIIAHSNALDSTIMVSPCSIDLIYPISNAEIIKKISEKGLILSEYKKCYRPYAHSFLQRNHIIIALADIVIIPQADLKSGSMSSAFTALKFQKPLYTIPHRVGESEGTNSLLEQGAAKAIYNISSFIQNELCLNIQKNDEILRFCANMPSFEEAFSQFGEKILEYELEGKLIRENGKIRIK